MSTNNPTQKFTIYLMKKKEKQLENYLKTEKTLTLYELQEKYGNRGSLFVGPVAQRPPTWAKFLETGIDGSLAQLLNTSTSAVLFIKRNRQVFAFTFGYGSSFLDSYKIERGFGLRVVANVIDPDSIRSLDKKVVQELTVHSRTQTSDSADLSEFGIDEEEDLLGHIAGMPKDKKFATTISGADSLQITGPIAFSELWSKCDEIMAAHNGQEYIKNGFELIDHVMQINDEELIEKLDNELLKEIRKKDPKSVHMAPPGIVDYESIDGYAFAPKAEPQPLMLLADFLSQIRNPGELSAERLRNQRVYIFRNGSDRGMPQWPVHRTLVCEKEISGHRYVLSGGKWFEIEQDFVKDIEKRMGRIKNLETKLPDAVKDQAEDSYNKMVAKKVGYVLADKECIRSSGDAIEFCDLYSTRREIIHVKRWSASSTLSHLFAQAKVSADELLYDEKFRKDVKKKLLKHSSKAGAQIPVKNIDQKKFKVVFAIIKGGGQGWKKELPFFSRLHLVRSAQELRRKGFKVRIARVKIK